MERHGKGKAMRLVPGDDLRDNNLNTLRLGFALLVVWSHCFAIWYGTEADEPISRLLGGVYNAGQLGVLAFFTISGFLITLSWQRSRSVASYLRRRIARIVPGYVVAVTLCSLVVVPILSDRRFGIIAPDEAIRLASNIFLRNYIIPSPGFAGAINGALWSIPYEFWCYLGVMALGLSGLLSRRTIVPLAALAVMLARTAQDVTGRRPGGGGIVEFVIGYPYFWFVVLPSFLLGMAALLYAREIPRSRALLLALIAATIASAWLPLDGGWYGAPTRLLLPPTLAYGLLYIAFHPRWRWGDAARYGDFSYGCYLYAFPLQQMLKAALIASGVVSFPLYVAIVLPASLLTGMASWFAVERWFEAARLRRRLRPLEEETILVAP